MKKMLQKGFTLIELLVVITIIGILATGAVTVYTGQMTKARDSVRSTDIKAIQGALEQAFLDNGVYPAAAPAFVATLAPFLPNLPADPRTATPQGGTALDYLYNVSANAAWVAQQEYEVSMGVERNTPLLTTDGGNDILRIESGVNTANANKNTTRAGLVDAARVVWECVQPAAQLPAATCSAVNPMVIR